MTLSANQNDENVSFLFRKSLKEQFTFVINPFDGHGTNFLGGISDHLELRRVFKLVKMILFSRSIKILVFYTYATKGLMRASV